MTIANTNESDTTDFKVISVSISNDTRDSLFIEIFFPQYLSFSKDGKRIAMKKELFYIVQDVDSTVLHDLEQFYRMNDRYVGSFYNSILPKLEDCGISTQIKDYLQNDLFLLPNQRYRFYYKLNLNELKKHYGVGNYKIFLGYPQKEIAEAIDYYTRLLEKCGITFDTISNFKKYSNAFESNILEINIE